MIVWNKMTDDEDISPVNSHRSYSWYLDRAGQKLSRWTSLQDMLLPSARAIPQHKWVQDADILQIFNLWGGYISYLSLPRLANGRPIIWRLSDEWVYTGHCVYSYHCNRWQSGCGECPQVHGEQSLTFDTSNLQWKLKQSVYSKLDLHLIAPSNWIASNIKKSPLLCDFPVTIIPNGVDTIVYQRQSQKAARAYFNLPATSPLLLFTSHTLNGGRKGGHILREILSHLPNSGGEVLLLGEGQTGENQIGDWQLHYLGYVRDENILSKAYAAADILILPSLADNLPNTALESLACGTPVVAFDVGGMSDAIQHMKTGYLARPYDLADFQQGISTLLSDTSLCKQMGIEGRILIESKFSLDQELQAFIRLYRSIIPTT
jgi:glycosyltransferase involved in cell wall biosynthesis